MEKPNKEKGLIYALLRAWPAIPYLGLGLSLAWPVMAFSGGIWLSDIEVNGENISRLSMSTSVVFGFVCLLAALTHRRFAHLIYSRKAILIAGAAGALGSMFIIFCGPYYLSQIIGMNAAPLFYIGGILTGIASAFLLLKCGQLYSELPPKKVLIYVALSHLLLACIYFIIIGAPSWTPVQGGPTASGIVSFIIAFPVAAFVLTLGSRSPKKSQAYASDNSAVRTKKDLQSTHNELRATGPARAHSSSSKAPDRAISFKKLPTAVWKFLAMLLLFSAAVSMIQAFVMQAYPVAETLENSSKVMVFRLLFVSLIILVTMSRDIKRINFGKIYSTVALVLVVVIAILPLIDVLNSSLNLIISAAVAVFEIVLFCLIVYISYQRRVPFTATFGFGYGVYMLGGVLGWIIGVSNPLATIDPDFLPIIYLLVAGLILVLAFLFFSERDFDRLFSAFNDSNTTLQSVLEAADEDLSESTQDDVRTHGRFIAALNVVAVTQDLSRRETEVFRYLAMGRGSEYIADHLSISWNTVRTHTQNIYIKLGVHSRNELMDLVDDLKK